MGSISLKYVYFSFCNLSLVTRACMCPQCVMHKSKFLFQRRAAPPEHGYLLEPKAKVWRIRARTVKCLCAFDYEIYNNRNVSVSCIISIPQIIFMHFRSDLNVNRICHFRILLLPVTILIILFPKNRRGVLAKHP